MTLDDRFVRSVADWLDDQAGAGTPGYLDDVLTRTRQTRQRHWWASLERWLSMDTTMRLAQAPKLSMLLVVIGLLVALAAIVVVAGSQPRLPAPFGLAENGAVLYGAKGDVYVMTPDGDHKASSPVRPTTSPRISRATDRSLRSCARPAVPGGRRSCWRMPTEPTFAR